MEKIQWCELCRDLTHDVEPARVRGGPLIMVCEKCLRTFPDKQKMQWGSAPFQYYWDLGNIKLCEGSGYRRPYIVNINYRQLVRFRAAGYVLAPYEEVFDGRCDGEG